MCDFNINRNINRRSNRQAVSTIYILAQVEYGTVEEARAAATDEEVKVKGVVTSIVATTSLFKMKLQVSAYLVPTLIMQIYPVSTTSWSIGTKAVFSNCNKSLV